MIFTTVDIILLSAFSCCWLIQLIYYWGYLAQPYYRHRSIARGKIVSKPVHPPVSLIIYARNEAENLEKYLPSILEQNYPLYEVIVVNDRSSDDTSNVLKRYALQYKHLNHTYIPPESKSVSRKKLALTLGIKAATYDTLLFLEADSHPVSRDWIQLMARHFTGDKTIVLGFSNLEQKPFLYAAYDYFFSDLQMMSLALMHHAYAGNGKNMGYSKNEFFQRKGFSSFGFLDAGDDDLFINEIAGKENVSVELSPDSVTQINMDEAWIWNDLKVRRMTTLPFYKRFSIIFRGIENGSRILFYILFVWTLVWFFPDWVLLGILFFAFLIRLFSQLFVINKTANMLKLPNFCFTLPFFDFIQPFVNGYFYLYKIFAGKRKKFGKRKKYWRYGKR
jgi:glycosyltransferase involved in cell wall biosynthesis